MFNLWRKLRAETLRRWVRTGDKVIIDENNDIFIVDRLKVTHLRLLFVHAKEVAAYVGNVEGPRLSSRPR
jgi:acyl-CoA synthetase (AMP-forming)/AMP-acid ligase II